MATQAQWTKIPEHLKLWINCLLFGYDTNKYLIFCIGKIGETNREIYSNKEQYKSMSQYVHLKNNTNIQNIQRFWIIIHLKSLKKTETQNSEAF